MPPALRLGAAIAVGALVLLPGCASFRGARLYQQGTAALDRGDVPRAVADLERAAELVPHASEIQNHLGLAYAEAGRDAEALRAFRRAVELDCDNRAARINLERAERGTARGGTPVGADGPAAPLGDPG